MSVEFERSLFNRESYRVYVVIFTYILHDIDLANHGNETYDQRKESFNTTDCSYSSRRPLLLLKRSAPFVGAVYTVRRSPVHRSFRSTAPLGKYVC